ncbi:hypothetical protein MODO_3741 [Myroides odoratimimus]|nr:hypothetical protein MODO_3741 [Myroides odoratimimus]
MKREFKEELNVNIEIVNHLYTQEDYVESYVKNGKQLLFIYYIVNIVDIENLKIIDDNIIDVVWKDLESKKPFNFLIDNIAVQKYTDS